MQTAKRPKRGTSWHVIGAQLAALRKAAGYTQAQLAEVLELDIETIASIEQGRRALKLNFAEVLDELLDTKGALAAGVKNVPQRERFPLFAQEFVDYEQEALTLLSYENQVVPGLLQTADYMRAVFSNLYPPLDGDELEEWVLARLERQEVLRRKPRPMLNFLLEESILHRPVGGEEVLRAQNQHLRQCAELPFLGLQIMPTQVKRHAGLAGPMVLLETPDHDQLAYVEGQRVSFLADDPDEASVLQAKYGMLRSQALSPGKSMDLLDALLGET
ncbi:helix-turn-helix domain-containing protein [Streptomyces qinzhouensis]|uniref:Transcriptional regulator n=1 Tax=Streptomyces qinzhouensis TaxID=2599401 RepID=A0A5B8JH63_9ACTN|nr:helix-turn-helix transcriptional regulator [Streptomyces qinzhouensis]QDY79191.1 transcriptional regulator [Streptomyces qinzhouensis]